MALAHGGATAHSYRSVSRGNAQLPIEDGKADGDISTQSKGEVK
jgi:hypothetical protein